MAGRPTAAKKTTGNASTEVVVGSAAQRLVKATEEFKAAVAEVDKLSDKAENLTLQVANKQSEIAELEVEFAEKKRQAEVELEVSLKANQERVVTSVLSDQGKVAVKREDYQAITSELASVKADFDKNVKAAEGRAEGIAKTRFENELKLKDAEFKAANAGNIAEITSLAKEVASLKEQSSKWEQALAEERKAGVQRAQASAIGNVNVTSGGK